MAIITEDYVSFETAKGFPQDPNICNTAYTTKGKLSNNAKSFAFYYELIKPRVYYTAPTLQMAMKWLREKNIIIVIQPEYFNAKSECSAWGCDTWWNDNYEKVQGDFSSYEKATEAAIKYCLENLI